MDVDARGNVYVASNLFKNNFWIFDNNGNLLHEEEKNIEHLSVDMQGSRLYMSEGNSDAYTVYFSRTYKPLEGSISGTVYHDLNGNCLQEDNEKGLPGIVVEAVPGPYYGITNENGTYTIAADTGSYTMRQVLPKEMTRTITQICPKQDADQKIRLTNKGTAAKGPSFGNRVVEKPHLFVNVSSDRRRRCFLSITTVSYSNAGFAAAPNSKVYLQLPDFVVLKSADKPFSRLTNGTYVFEVGNVAAGQRSVISIQNSVLCGDESIRGLTVCTKAWITPINQSPTAPSTAVSAVTGTCDNETGSVRFVIKNTGSADMEVGKQFRLYRDGQLSTLEDYRLAAGDSMVLRVPAMGKTVRLEADQPEGNGDNTQASVTVEACSTVATRTAVSTGFVNTMPTDDEEAEVAEECLPIIDSFDPNDKLVTPEGRTKEQYTPTGTPLKYKIRFQNTGTDVAYRVVVVDALTEHLDLSTLQIGSASHNFIFSVSGKGQPVLTWTFNNIMLPDSTSNEPGSHGYIQFSIKPKADLPEKTAVENFADIFFDFNSPVRTNITLNRIFDMPPVITEEHRLAPEEIIASPVITGFSPAAGKFGSAVTLQGRNFSAVPEENKLWFHGTAATITAASATELQVLVPAGARTGRVKVQTKDGATQSPDVYTVYQPPLITSLIPGEGVVGTEVRLQGSFLADGGVESVQLGERTCQVISVSEKEVVVRVAEEALTGSFLIQTKGGVYKHPAAFVVWHQPTISSLSKLTDKAGSEVEIMGEHFAPAAQRNKVLFGQAQADVLQASEARLKVRVPRGSTSGPVTVETPGGMATSAAVFEVIPAPVLTEVTPASGSVGTVVELKGFHFLTLGQQDTIYFGGTKALVLSASETKTVVRVPRGAKTGKVQVAGIGGVTNSTSDFVVEDLTPQQAIAVYPNPTTGKFTINFIRANFEVQKLEIVNTIGVKVFSHPVTQEHQLEVNLPGLSAGLYLIQLTTSRGTITKKINLL